MELKIFFAVLLTIPGFIYCAYTATQFTFFLSSHTHLTHPRLKDVSVIETVELSVAVFIDFGLLTLFAIQHSLQIKLPMKYILSYMNLEVLERLVYNVSTCLVLQIMMTYWQAIPSWTIWECSTYDNELLWFFFTVTHFAFWIVIYTGCIILDMFELMGVKQVFYLFCGWPDPLVKKSRALIRFYKHMRHPGLCEFFAICFIHPIMQLDRLILGLTFTIYMITAFQIDESDCSYHKEQFRKKKELLQRASHN